MCNGTYVCFDCRLAARRAIWWLIASARPWLIGQVDERVRCARCHAAMRFVGPTVKIPPRHDGRAWRRLHRELAERHGKAVDERVLMLVRRRQAIERRIRELESRPRSEGRAELIRSLRSDLASEAYRVDHYYIRGA